MSDASVRSGDKKRRTESEASSAPVAQQDVYDTHGNDLLARHLEEAKQHQGGDEELSVLQAAAEQQKDEDKVEQAVDIDEDEELLALRDQEGGEVDGELLKQGLMQGAGSERLLQLMDDAQSDMEMPPMNPDAQRKVLQQVEDQIDTSALSLARSMDDVDQVMRQALRDNALRVREEVMLLLMRLMSSPKEMAMIAELPEKGDRAIQVIEYLAEYTAELDDLHALAGYDHRDLLHRVPVMSDEAKEIRRYLSPMALAMGSFAPVVFQMISNELDRLPRGGKAKQIEALDGGEETDTSGMEKALTQLLNDMRLARYLQG